MPYLFSPSMRAFYHTDVPYSGLPEDVVEVSDEEHEGIMEDLLLHGKALQADANGAPQAVDAVSQAKTAAMADEAGDGSGSGAKGSA